MLVLALAVVVAATGAWRVTSGSRGGIATDEPARMPALVTAAPPAVEAAAAAAVVYDAFTSETIAPQQPTPLDRMTLSGQSWRRGGLGANAQVSFTLRNNNAYAVRDVEIACDFVRPDGRHLTERTRRVPGVVPRRGRRSVARLHIGFVNVNASKAKCALVSAARA